MSLTRITLIRHGETEWNRTSRWQGQADVSLSAIGFLQAQRLAERFLSEHIIFKTLYTSDLLRACQTADVLGKALKLTAISERALRELDVGTWSGLLDSEVAARFPGEWRRVRADEDIPRGGAENMAALYARATTAFETITAKHSGENIGLVTHNGVIRVILLYLKKLPLSLSNDLGPIQNCSITVIRGSSGNWEVERVNDTAHLDGFAPPPDLLAL